MPSSNNDTVTRLSVADHLDALQTSTRPVALVTGATGGIGRATVTALTENFNVVAQGRDERILRELGELEHVYPVQADLTDLESIEGTFASLPRVDALIHAAAIAPRFSVEDARPADWESVMRLNVHAPAELTRVLLPQLRESQGTIVFLGSGASRKSYPINVIYAASKHALQALADGVRQQVQDDMVRVTTVAPGPTDTPMIRWEDNYPLVLPETPIEPTTVARSIRHAVEAPADTQLTEIWVRPRREA